MSVEACITNLLIRPIVSVGLISAWHALPLKFKINFLCTGQCFENSVALTSSSELHSNTSILAASSEE